MYFLRKQNHFWVSLFTTHDQAFRRISSGNTMAQHAPYLSLWQWCIEFSGGEGEERRQKKEEFCQEMERN